MLSVLLPAAPAALATSIPSTAPAPAAAAAAAESTAPLVSTGRLGAGSSMVSANRFVRLTMQSDGNLVLTGGGRALWSSRTSGSGNYAAINAKGNFAVYNSAGTPIWQTGTWFSGAGSRVVVSDSGNLHVENWSKTVQWQSGTRVWLLMPGVRLGGGQSLQAPGGARLEMGSNGNLAAIGEAGRVMWMTGTYSSGAYAIVRSTGDLAVLSAAGRLLWSSHTTAGSTVRVGNDGTISVNASSGSAVWFSGANAATMLPGTVLRAGEFLRAPSGELLNLRSTGNLVIWRSGSLVWQSGVNAPGSTLRLTTDGNLVEVSPAGRTVWSSGTHATGSGIRLVAAAGGSFRLVTPGGAQLWSVATSSSATAVELANRALARWPSRIDGRPGVLSDLRAVSAGRTIKNSSSCGHSVTIHRDLLAVLDRLTARYSLYFDNIVTGHSCDTGQHPRGRAFDLNRATDLTSGATTNFASYRAGDNQSLDRAVMTATLGLLKPGVMAGLGQKGCPGRNIAIPAGFEFFADSCTHQHVTVTKR